MRKVKWIFIAYLAFVALLVIALGAAMHATPPHDSQAMHTAYMANIKSLDPPEINDDLGNGLAGQIFECLYNYKYDIRPYELFPELAEELPEVSGDGLTVTIKIRPGIHYYDPDKVVFPDGIGPEVAAGDFVYSWKRIADFHLASPLYSQLLQGRIVGLDGWWDYTKATRDAAEIDWDKPVEGLQTPDSRTLVIKLTEPYPQLNFNLAYLPTAAVCRKVVEHYRDEVRRHPIGTGAYGLRRADYEPDQRIVMHANPIYRGRQDVDGGAVVPPDQRLPHIQHLDYYFFREDLPIWLLFQQGYFDTAGIPKDSFAKAIKISTGDLTEEMRGKGIVLTKSTAAETAYFGFNMTDPVVGKNKPLRQAISMGFDRATYIRIFLNGRGIPAIGPIPPGFPTFDTKRGNPYTKFNPDAARQQVAQAIEINGGPLPSLQLLMGDTDTQTRQEAEFFTSQMKNIGINIHTEYRTWARFQEMVDNRQTQIFQLGWVADYPDEQDFFQLFYGKNAPAGGSNPCGYVNPEFDALYEKASVMQRSSQRDELYRKMEQIVMDDCPWATLLYPLVYALHYDWLRHTSDMDYGYGLRQHMALGASLREERLAGGK